MHHALGRLGDRIPDLPAVSRLIEQAESRYSRGDVAVRLVVLDAHRGPRTMDYYERSVSNGDEVWAILRGGACITVMLRRSDQPKTRQALRVDAVVLWAVPERHCAS